MPPVRAARESGPGEGRGRAMPEVASRGKQFCTLRTLECTLRKDGVVADTETDRAAIARIVPLFAGSFDAASATAEGRALLLAHRAGTLELPILEPNAAPAPEFGGAP